MNLKKAQRRKPLPVKELRWMCNPKIFDFQSTEELEPIEGILGQDRALKALKLGVNLKSSGYNIYISGLTGTGKASTVKKILETVSSTTPELKDFAYVNNFNDSDKPTLLVFKQGEAKRFKDEISGLIIFLKEQIPLLLEGQQFQSKKNKIIQEYELKEKNLFQKFESKLQKDGFTIGQMQVGEVKRPELLPVINDKAIPVFQLDELVVQQVISKDEAEKLKEKYSLFRKEMAEIYKKGLKINQEFQQKLNELEKNEVELLVNGVMNAFREKYEDEKILNYLQQIEDNILQNLFMFKTPKGETDIDTSDFFRQFVVNIILDNSNVKTVPTIIETAPTYTNIFGTIEKISDGRGGWYADFTKIKAGSLLRASGGFLVLNVNHVFEEPGVWRTLKRVLTYKKLDILDAPSYFQFSPSSLKPEPIDIDTKVILVGSNYAYSILTGYEDDFKKIFKVKAEFDYEIERTGENMVEYARVIKKLIKEENLLEFDKSAIAYLLELSARYAGKKNKLSSRFSMISDFAREANYWAMDAGAKTVSVSHVQIAFTERENRHALGDEKLTSMIKEGDILIDTKGKKVGEINGLAVYGSDLYSFGKPTKITSAVSLGNGSIINVEREAGMSGKTYDKGVLIIGGYFRETFGQNIPLSFSATLVFEQSYGLIDGDSASAAEIIVLLSTLSGIPINQEMAVTGSVNQKGDIQTIGGVNEKIEGFFKICKLKGFTGNQGVVIPHGNIQDLMLSEEVISAVKNKKFKIFAVKRIEEAVELMTGVKAGKKDSKGHFESGTLYHTVENRLKKMHSKAKPTPKKNDNDEKNKNNKKK